MFAHNTSNRIEHLPFALPILMAVFTAMACDPREVKDLFDGHGGQPSSPPTGKADGGGSPPVDPCAATLCSAGTHCEAQAAECVAPPCPTVPVCVKNPPVVRCGGLTGATCPGLGKCADDPADSCDPNAGGADCSGICQCVQQVLCVPGAVFDGSATVCACVKPPTPPPVCNPVCDIFCANGHVVDAKGCPLCGCNPPTPLPDPCATVRCAGGTHCVATPVQCVKAPCPPVASCAPDAPVVHCGGIAGIACPGAGKCVDDPSDTCNPQKGGADCGGLCACVQNVMCAKGATFDSSPKVCACVVATPPPPVCGPVCQIFCQYGNVLDANGCKTCRCNPAPVLDPATTPTTTTTTTSP